MLRPLNPKEVVQAAIAKGLLSHPGAIVAPARVEAPVVRYKLPNEAGIARLPTASSKPRERLKPDPKRRKWITRGEAAAMGYGLTKGIC